MMRFASLLSLVLAALAAPAGAQPWAGADFGKDVRWERPAFGARAPGVFRGGRAERDGREDRSEARGGRLMPLARALEGVRRRTPGRLLDAGLEDSGRPVYRVRWAADDGRRIDYVVDAENGQILSAE